MQVFNHLIDVFFKQIASATSDKKDVTLIFDKGNNSEDTIVRIDESRHHFIGSRSPYHHMDICSIPLEKYEQTEVSDGCGGVEIMPTFETAVELYGKSRRVIVIYNELTYRRQLHRMERNLEKAKAELSFFKKKVKTADGRSTQDSIRKTAEEIIGRYHVGGLLEVDVNEESNGYRVSARKNILNIKEAKSRFGKQVLFTNRETMTRGDVINAYADRAIVESAFRITKSDSWIKWGPAFHWTDSKIRVHALTCVIALLLVKIAHRRARQAGFEQGIERMMELLSSVRSALIYYPKSNKPHRKMCSISEDAKDLLSKLGRPIQDSM